MHTIVNRSGTRVAWILAACLAMAAMVSATAPSAAAQGAPTGGTPVVVDPTSCGHFETQADAQAALDAGTLDDPESLDPDGDGIACEHRWGEIEGGPVVVERTSCGHFETQEDAQEALDSKEVLNAEHLDVDGDGVACEIRWGDDDGDTEGTTEDAVVSLPDTGTGPADGSTVITIAMLAGLSVISVAGAWSLQMKEIR